MKPRNREINIFNMSLLDILCGALGAFCFMMITLFPYYSKKGAASSENSEDASKLKQELEQARAQLQDAMRHMSNGQPAQQQSQQAAQQLQQAEQQLAQAQNKAAEQEKSYNEILGLTNPALVIAASWFAPEADVDLWIRNPDKTWDGPKKETPDGGRLFYQLVDVQSGPGAELDYFPGGRDGNYQVFFRLMSRGANPFRQPVPVETVITRLSLVKNEKDGKLNMRQEHWSALTVLNEEKKMVPAFTIVSTDKEFKLVPYGQSSR